MNVMLDTVIVGGSAAGLSAALYLGRFRRRVIVFDTQKRANRFSHASHSFFTRDGVAPADLVAIGREQLTRYESVEIQNREVSGIVPDGEHFVVTLVDGSIYKTRKILLATGLNDALPAIEGIEPFFGRSVFHCPYCDGWEQRDQPVAIINSGEASLHLAKLLHVLTAQLTLCTNGDESLDQAARALLNKLNIRLIEKPIQRLEGQGTQVESVTFVDGSKIACKAVFVRLISTQHADLAEQLGCAMTDAGLVQVDEMGNTSVPSVYAAGDLANRMRQVIFAASQGAAAAIAINMALITEDFG
jgi:thioredoxin reductase